MSETEESKRLASSLKTGDKELSKITALSQEAINKAMGNLLTQYPEMADVNAHKPGTGTLKAKTGQPLVAFTVTGATRANVEYFCQISSGKLHFHKKDPIDVAGWTIAFDVSIDKATVEKDSEEDQRVRSAIQQPGDFSLSSLYLKFNDSNIIRFNADNSDFKGYVLDEDQSLDLGVILAKWYTGTDSVMNDREKRTLAYGLETTKPQSVNQNAPTFPPTALRFQTYEYIAPGKQEPEEGIGKGDNNMLLYLQMTGRQDFPSQDILNYSGNYVSRGMHGTTCIAREIFWDSYLLRTSAPLLLQLFNVSTYAWAKEASVHNQISPEWTIGLGESDHFDASNGYCWKATSDPPFDWVWNPHNSEQSYYQENNANDIKAWLKIDCTTNNAMKTQPGSNKIDLSGKTEITVEASSFFAYASIAWYMHYKMHIWVNWNTKITLESVQEGGLKISLEMPQFKVDSDPFYPTADEGWSGKADDLIKQFQDLKDDLQNRMENFPLLDAQKALQEDLANSARFVIPGGGTFIYDNPIFNDNGDLMIAASYQD